MTATTTAADRAATPGRFQALAAFGFSVFPIRHPDRDGEHAGKRGKTPTGPWRSYQETPATPEKISLWDTGLLNVGLATGAVSGVVVFDIDSPEVRAQLESRGLTWPRTPTVKTGRGWHVYFAHPGPPVGNKVNLGDIEHLDFRGDGGYAVGPGSRHENGALYAWEISPEEEPFAPAPPWLWELHHKAKAPPRDATDGEEATPAKKRATKSPGRNGNRDPYADAALRSEVDRVRAQTEPGRNDTLNRAAFSLGQLVGGGSLDRVTVESELTAAAEACGLVRDDGAGSVGATIRSGLEGGMREPRTRPEPPARTPAVAGHQAGADAPDPPRPTPAPANDAPKTLPALLAVYRRWLYLPDEEPLYAALATVAANRALDGDPVWLLIVGTPGSGKTESIQPLTALADVHSAGTITEASLLSGTPKKEHGAGSKGGLLRAIGDRGILLLKDFGSILSMNREARAAVMAALREIYDGAWTRHVGADGGKALEWKGRLGLIGGCTPTLDGHHAVMASLGERFLLVRIQDSGTLDHARRALKHAGKETSMRRELAAAVAGFFAALPTMTGIETITPEETEDLVQLCSLVARCRSSVERDSYRREIDLIPGAESPTRLSVTCLRLFSGLIAIGAPRPKAWQVVRRVALDSMPALRLRVLRELFKLGETGTGTVSRALGYPTQTTRRTLEDLAVYDIVKRFREGAGKEDKWRLSEDLEALLGTFPEMSKGEYTEAGGEDGGLFSHPSPIPTDKTGTVPGDPEADLCDESQGAFFDPGF
jgi:hypothetical protein